MLREILLYILCLICDLLNDDFCDSGSVVSNGWMISEWLIGKCVQGSN